MVKSTKLMALQNNQRTIDKLRVLRLIEATIDRAEDVENMEAIGVMLMMLMLNENKN